MNTTDKKYIYIKINYTGYIELLNAYGPVKGSWVEVNNIKELVKEGYDIEILNPNVCREFYDELERYKLEIANIEKVKKKNLKDVNIANVIENSEINKVLNEVIPKTYNKPVGIVSPTEDYNAQITSIESPEIAAPAFEEPEPIIVEETIDTKQYNKSNKNRNKNKK